MPYFMEFLLSLSFFWSWDGNCPSICFDRFFVDSKFHITVSLVVDDNFFVSYSLKTFWKSIHTMYLIKVLLIFGFLFLRIGISTCLCASPCWIGSCRNPTRPTRRRGNRKGKRVSSLSEKAYMRVECQSLSDIHLGGGRVLVFFYLFLAL